MIDRAVPETFDDPGLSWSQLRSFEACVRLSSFSAAALALNVSASAVRIQVGLLEARLSVKLFDRQDGRLALTAIGQTFARQTARPVRDLLAACAAATRSAVDAPVTLTAPLLFARHFLLGGAFLAWCDANHVRLDVSDIKRDLYGPSAIAAVRFDPIVAPDCRAIPLVQVSLCLAATPEVAAVARPQEPHWWAQQTLVCPSAGDEGWVLIWGALRVDPPVSPRRLPYSSYAAAMAAACAGHGVILAPLPFAHEEFAAARLAPLSNVRIPSTGGYSLVMRDTVAACPRGRALARQLSELCAGEVKGRAENTRRQRSKGSYS